MEPSPCVPLAPSLGGGGGAPLLGVAALSSDASSSSSLVVAVTAAGNGGGVSIVDAKCQELKRTWMLSSNVVLRSAAVWDCSGGAQDEASSSTSAPRLAALASSSASSSSSADLLSWPSDMPEGSIDSLADRVSLPSRPIALLGEERRRMGAVVVFGDGGGRSVRSLLLGENAARASAGNKRGEAAAASAGSKRGEAAAASAGSKRGEAAAASTSTATLACLISGSSDVDGGAEVAALLGRGAEGLTLRRSAVVDVEGEGGHEASSSGSSAFSVPPLPAPPLAIASVSTGGEACTVVVLCRDGTLAALELRGGHGEEGTRGRRAREAGTARIAWKHKLASFPFFDKGEEEESAAKSANAPATPNSRKRGKAGGPAEQQQQQPSAALVVADGGRSVIAVYHSSLPRVVRAVAVDVALGAPRGVALVELPEDAPAASDAFGARAPLGACPASPTSTSVVVSSRVSAFVVSEEAFAAPSGTIAGIEGNGKDLASLVGSLANGGGGPRGRGAAGAAAPAAFDDGVCENGGGERAAKAKARSSGSASPPPLPLLVQPDWASSPLGQLPCSAGTGTEARAGASAVAPPSSLVAVPIPLSTAATSCSELAGDAASPPPHFVAAAEALRKMEAELASVAAGEAAAESARSTVGGANKASRSSTAKRATSTAAAAESWAEAASASTSPEDDDGSDPVLPLPIDLHARAASAAARLGHWDAVRRALSALPLSNGGGDAFEGLMPAAAAAGEYEVLSAVASSPAAADAPPSDVAAVVSHCLLPVASAGGGDVAAGRERWRRALAVAAEDSVSAAEEAAAAVSAAEEAAAAGASRTSCFGGASQQQLRQRTLALAVEAASAVAAASSFGAADDDDAIDGLGQLALHALVAAPRDDAALQAALRLLPAAAAPALARYLARWAEALAPLPAVGSAAGGGGAGGSLARHGHHGDGNHRGGQHDQRRRRHPCGRLPTLSDVAAWASALVDAHLVALASSAAAADDGSERDRARTSAKGAAPLTTKRALGVLRSVAAERAADAEALAPLLGAAGHVLRGAPLPTVAVAAAAAYSVEMLDLGVRR